MQPQNPEELKSYSAQPVMYAHMLNVAAGTFQSDYQVDEVRKLDAADVATLNAGMCVYIDPTTGLFKQGLPAGYLPFLAKPCNGYSGVPEAGNAYGDGILALPVTVGQLVETTEYVSAQDYPPNQPLTAVNVGADKGKVTPGVYYTDTILGVVVNDVQVVVTGKSMLRFLTYFLPPLEGVSGL